MGELLDVSDIVIGNERWFSPELQLVVAAKTTDPRAGETEPVALAACLAGCSVEDEPTKPAAEATNDDEPNANARIVASISGCAASFCMRVATLPHWQMPMGLGFMVCNREGTGRV